MAVRVLDTELFLRHATVIFAESSMRNVDNWTFCYAIWRSCRSESCKAVAYLICPHEGVTDSYDSSGAGSGSPVAACDRRPLLDIYCPSPRAVRLRGVADRLLPSADRMLYAPTPRSEGGGSTSSPIRRENEIGLLRRHCENRRSHAITGHLTHIYTLRIM